MKISDPVDIEHRTIAEILIGTARAAVVVDFKPRRMQRGQRGKFNVLVRLGTGDATLTVDVAHIEPIARHMIRKGRYVQAHALRLEGSEAAPPVPVKASFGGEFDGEKSRSPDAYPRRCAETACKSL